MPTSPESLLISSVLRSQDMNIAVSAAIVPAMFHVYDEEWRWLDSYFRKYKKCPSKAAFLAKFDDFRMTPVNDTAHYTDEVRKSHAQHLLTEALKDTADFLANGDVTTALKKVHAEVIAIGSAMGNDTDADIISDYHSVLADAEHRRMLAEEDGTSGVPYGFSHLDEETGGAQKGDLIVVAARLGEGKSWILQRMAANAILAGRNVQFNALEQTRSAVTMRIHALLSGQGGRLAFGSNALMQGREYDLKAYRKFVRELPQTVKGKMHVTDRSAGRVSTMQVAAQIEKNHPDIVFIDYLTLMDKTSNDWQGIGQISNELAQIAGEYNVPIVAAAQLNREHGLGREPASAEALAGSDAIGQDAAVILTQKQVSPSVLKMRMAKNRNGAGDFKWWVRFQPGLGVIQEVTRKQAEKLMDQDADEQDKIED